MTEKKRSSLKVSPALGPKLGEDQKKGLHSNFDRFLAKKKCLPTVSMLKPTAQATKWGGHATILRTILCQLYYPGDPKRGAMAPPKYAPG